MTTSEWISRAKSVHGDKYDYSRVHYLSSKEKVFLKCNICGNEFWQEANSHLKGCGCIMCARNRQCYNNLETFIKDAKKVHGDKYIYKEINFSKKTDVIEIICRKHGGFKTTPLRHLQGHNCPHCAVNAKMTTEDFITKARQIHGDKYDYSKVEYVNNRTKVCIICKECGNEFLMTPNSHLSGQKCRICAYKEMGLHKRMTTEDFITKARQIHGDKYDYSKVEYVNFDTPVCIICSEKDDNGIIHGEFWQTPHKHLSGGCCSKCNEFKLEREVRLLLEKNNIDYIFQTSKKDFKWLNRLSLDFYLPNYNIAIECQGIQHFEPVDFAGKGAEWARCAFEKLKERDILKKKLCADNGIDLIYYSDKMDDDVFNNLNDILICIKNKKIGINT